MSKKDRAKLFGLNGKRMPNQVSLCFLTGDNSDIKNMSETELSSLCETLEKKTKKIKNPDSVKSHFFIEFLGRYIIGTHF